MDSTGNEDTGAMTLSPPNGPKLEYPGGSEELPTHANLHYLMIENFVAAVVDRAHLFASGESSIWTDWVTERALRGCKRHAAASPF